VEVDRVASRGSGVTDELESRPPARRRYLRVAEEVLRAVALGSLSVGDRLPDERDLSNRYGVSRSTVREALMALELGGVVEIRPGAGCFLAGMGVHTGPSVSLPMDTSPRDLLEVRQLIEPAAARLCARATSPETLARLRAMVDDAEAFAGSDDPEGLDHFVIVNLAFHRELALSCGNTILANITGRLVDGGEHPLWVLVDGMVVRAADTRAQQVTEHRRILDAITAGRGDLAEEAMTAHLGAMSSRMFGSEATDRPIRQTRRHAKA
jgi:DNA-binding FadR family transcriptional regulator